MVHSPQSNTTDKDWLTQRALGLLPPSHPIQCKMSDNIWPNPAQLLTSNGKVLPHFPTPASSYCIYLLYIAILALYIEIIPLGVPGWLI